jgi:hypothetical protein
MKRVLTIIVAVLLMAGTVNAGYYEPFWEVYGTPYEYEESPSYCTASTYSSNGFLSAYAGVSFDENAGLQADGLESVSTITIKTGYRWTGSGTPVGGIMTYGYSSDEESCSAGYARGNGVAGCGGHAESYSTILNEDPSCYTEVHGSCNNGSPPRCSFYGVVEEEDGYWDGTEDFTGGGQFPYYDAEMSGSFSCPESPSTGYTKEIPYGTSEVSAKFTVYARAVCECTVLTGSDPEYTISSTGYSAISWTMEFDQN